MHTVLFSRHLTGILIASASLPLASLAAQAATAMPQRATSGTPVWTTLRTKVGDTVVVRNSGTTSAAAELRIVEELRITGEDIPGTPGFSSITWLTPAHDGGVLLHEGGSRQIMHFNASGKFVRVVGGRGVGPGEYDWVRGIVQGRDGSIYMARTYGDGHSYSRGGVYKQSWPAVVRGATATMMAVADDGWLSIRTLLAHRGKPDSLTPFGTVAVGYAVVRLHPDSSRMDTIYAPVSPRELKMVPYRSTATVVPGRTPTHPIPLVPYYAIAYSSRSYWIGGDPERYSLTLYKAGAPLKIESDYRPIRPSAAERQSLLDNYFYRLKAGGAELATPLSIIPLSKPAFKSFETDADGRIWVLLHREGVREARDTIRMRDSLMRNQFTMVDGKEVPRQGAPVAPGRPSLPTDRWVEPVAYDIFAPSGEFMGRLSVPSNVTWRNSSGNKIWMVVRDEFDVPTLVRYRVTGPSVWGGGPR